MEKKMILNKLIVQKKKILKKKNHVSDKLKKFKSTITSTENTLKKLLNQADQKSSSPDLEEVLTNVLSEHRKGKFK